MTQIAEDKPLVVSCGAKHDGEAASRFNRYGAKPWIWTVRMLTALDEGVKGGRWYSLIDKVYAKTTLTMAAVWVTRDERKASGVDHVSPGQFAKRLSEEVDKLAGQLSTGTYRPQAIRRVYIPKPGSREQRPLGIPTIRSSSGSGGAHGM